MSALLTDGEIDAIISEAGSRAMPLVGASAKDCATVALTALFLQRAIEFSLDGSPEWEAYLEARAALQAKLDGVGKRAEAKLGIEATPS